MKRWMLHGVVFAVGALVAAFAWPAQAPARKHGLRSAYEDLGLTSKVASEMERLDAQLATLCRATGDARRALYAELAKAQPDRAEVDRLAANVTATRAEIQKHVVEHLLAVGPLLTAEERTRLMERLSSSSGREAR